MQPNVQFSTLLPSATHQDGIEETSSGDQLELHRKGSPISVFGCPYVIFVLFFFLNSYLYK